MITLARPNKVNEFGWYVCEDVPEGHFADYLHTNGEMYPSTTNGTESTGYFPTELDAYKAIYNYFFERI